MVSLGITQRYLPPEQVNKVRLNRSQTGRYRLDLPTYPRWIEGWVDLNISYIWDMCSSWEICLTVSATYHPDCTRWTTSNSGTFHLSSFVRTLLPDASCDSWQPESNLGLPSPCSVLYQSINQSIRLDLYTGLSSKTVKTTARCTWEG